MTRVKRIVEIENGKLSLCLSTATARLIAEFISTRYGG
jgi:hypothetical protein